MGGNVKLFIEGVKASARKLEFATVLDNEVVGIGGGERRYYRESEGVVPCIFSIGYWLGGSGIMEVRGK